MLYGLEAAEMQTRRAEWAERVGQWRRSGLTAKAFARLAGVKAGSLTHWAWRLGRDARRGGTGLQAAEAPRPSALVEITPAGGADEPFELEVRSGWRLRIPASFDAAALVRLLTVLEARG